jgi:hypothetical protein
MRYAIFGLFALLACGGAKDQTLDTVKVTDSTVVDSGPGKDTLVADSLFYRDHKPKKEK